MSAPVEQPAAQEEAASAAPAEQPAAESAPAPTGQYGALNPYGRAPEPQDGP